ncbi:MAG TPA: hypothetical protein VIT42_06160 [Microlunatus sp.]
MTYAPIEELVLPYDRTEPQQKVTRRRRLVRGRIISLVLTVVILVALYIWQRAAFGPGLWVVYGVLFGVSIAWLAVYVVGYAQAKRELASIREGVALRIGRAGVQVADVFAYWPQISGLRVVKGRVGRSPRFRMEHSGGFSDVPLDQLGVLPATLDTTARAYSAGRHGVDLSALDA